MAHKEAKGRVQNCDSAAQAEYNPDFLFKRIARPQLRSRRRGERPLMTDPIPFSSRFQGWLVVQRLPVWRLRYWEIEGKVSNWQSRKR